MPIIHDVDQYSIDWYRLRMGVPTASSFEKIVTPKGILSKQARKYAYFLIAEELLKESLESTLDIEWMERGKDLEEQAIKSYEFSYDVKTKAVGFITTDDGRIGCSPDRMMIGLPGALEVKVPAPQTHVQYMVDGFGDDYMPQAQGQILVAELDWVERYSYHPRMPPVRIRTFRDEKFIRTLRSSLIAFNEMKDAMIEKVRAQGFFQEADKPMTPHEAHTAALRGVDELEQMLGNTE